MIDDNAIINPFKGRSAPDPGPLLVLVSGPRDMTLLGERLRLDPERSRPLLMSRLLVGPDGGFSLAGPAMGAPYAVLLMETLIAWGARQILFFGSCGAISPDLAVGDVLVPSGSIIDEGTSSHYTGKTAVSHPAPGAVDPIRSALSQTGTAFAEPLVWTTDALYRETPGKVARFLGRGAAAVEMELSALFTVARYREVQAAGVLVVSDLLTRRPWRPGFKNPRFREARRAVAEAIAILCGRER